MGLSCVVVHRGALYDETLLFSLYDLDRVATTTQYALVPRDYDGFVSESTWLFIAIRDEKVVAKIEYNLLEEPKRNRKKRTSRNDMLFELDDDPCTAHPDEKPPAEPIDAQIVHRSGDVTCEVLELFEKTVEPTRLRNLRVVMTSSIEGQSEATTEMINSYIKLGFMFGKIQQRLIFYGEDEDQTYAEVTIIFTRQALSPRACACRENLPPTPSLSPATSTSSKRRQQPPPPPVPPPPEDVPLRPRRAPPPPPPPLSPQSANAMNHDHKSA